MNRLAESCQPNLLGDLAIESRPNRRGRQAFGGHGWRTRTAWLPHCIAAPGQALPEVKLGLLPAPAARSACHACWAETALNMIGGRASRRLLATARPEAVRPHGRFA
jgi:hypothetical protein